MPKLAKNREEGAAKNICKNLNLNIFSIDYIFVYLENFDSFHLDLL